ncbi:MAG: hypothetical protein OXH24_03865 [Cyanobacteria bacterium MAG IRC3_bin_20]|nr:hypothetical protein [Cyanobacteria bacterium MAG IRC3_bin_20]
MRKSLQELQQKEAWDCVADWKVKTEDDPFNDRAIWVWVVLENMQEFERPGFEQRDKIRRRVLDTIDKPDETRWVYIQFSTKEEKKRQEAQEVSP